MPVVRRLRVGVISTGDELVPPSETPGAGQVRDVVSAQSGAPAKAARILAFLTEAPALVIGGRQVDSVNELLSILMHSSMSDIEAIADNQALDSWLYAHKCSNVLTELESFR